MNKKLSRRDFLKLAGVTSAGFALSACGVKATDLTMATSTLPPTIAPSMTPSPIPSSTSSPTPKPPSLRGYAEKIQINGESFKIGTTADYGDPDWDTNIHQQTVVNEFNQIVSSGAFMFQWMDKYPTAAPHWLDLAEKNNLAFEIKQIFWQGDEPFTVNKESVNQESVKQFMIERIRKVLPYVSKKVPTQIVLANEPFWEYKGDRGWQGKYGGSPFYQVYGEKWIAEAYSLLYQIAKDEFGLIVGKDFRVIGLNERGISTPSHQTDFVISQVNKIKQDISSKLRIPVEQVPFDLGTEFHFGETNKNRDITVKYSDVDKDIFKNTLIEINQQTGCPIFVTETSDLGGTEDDVAKAYSTLITAAIESGVVRGVEFWATFTFQSNPPWQCSLFLPGFEKGKVYNSVLNTLSQFA
jgi:hypothetical protein